MGSMTDSNLMLHLEGPRLIDGEDNIHGIGQPWARGVKGPAKASGLMRSKQINSSMRHEQQKEQQRLPDFSQRQAAHQHSSKGNSNCSEAVAAAATTATAAAKHHNHQQNQEHGSTDTYMHTRNTSSYRHLRHHHDICAIVIYTITINSCSTSTHQAQLFLIPASWPHGADDLGAAEALSRGNNQGQAGKRGAHGAHARSLSGRDCKHMRTLVHLGPGR
eukprot:1162035-Pelagomonas_calceolata.AAC.13